MGQTPQRVSNETDEENAESTLRAKQTPNLQGQWENDIELGDPLVSASLLVLWICVWLVPVSHLPSNIAPGLILVP